MPSQGGDESDSRITSARRALAPEIALEKLGIVGERVKVQDDWRILNANRTDHIKIEGISRPPIDQKALANEGSRLILTGIGEQWLLQRQLAAVQDGRGKVLDFFL